MFAWMDRIFARRETRPPNNERHHVLAFPARSDAGVFVDQEKALQCSTAWACGTLIARSIAMMPARVMAPRGPDEADGNERLVDHPVEGLLHREANPETSAFRFREGALLSAIFSGNAFAEIERDQAGRPFALWPIHSDRVTVCRDDAGQLEYEISNGAVGKVVVPNRDMFHLAGPSMCGPIGMSLISYARQTLGLALAQETFAGTFIRNQAAPSGMVKLKSPVSPDGFARLKAEFNQVHAGPRKAGKVLFGDGDWEWVPIGISPQDSEFLEQRRFAVEEIARWFGVPPQMIGDTAKQTFANFEQAGLNFLSLGLLPWIVRFEQEVNRKLLRKENGRRPFLKINPAAIVRANLEAQYRAFALGRQWGWLSVNDIRRLIDMEPLGPEGDVYLTPLNMSPVAEGGGTADDGAPDDVGDTRRALAAIRQVA